MADQTANDMAFVAETSGCQTQVLLEIAQVGAAHVTQLLRMSVERYAITAGQVGNVVRSRGLVPQEW